MPSRRGFTLIEMLTTVAVLIIVLGLMVSLARYVREQSANQLTAALLHKLDLAVRRYADRNGGQLPPVTPLLAEGEKLPDEATLHRAARHNNEQFTRALREDLVRFRLGESSPRRQKGAGKSRAPGEATSPSAAGPPQAGNAPSSGEILREDLADPVGDFGELPISIYDDVTLRDAWGDPIVFMPREHPAIGMASRDHPSFFFSAGPDHRYLTRDDNLYSYEAER